MRGALLIARILGLSLLLASLAFAGESAEKEQPSETQKTAGKAEHFAGHCDAPFPPIEQENWQRLFQLAPRAGKPNHRVRDVILPPGYPSTTLRARFTYGEVDKDLEGESVQAWLLRCPQWELLGTFETDDEGIVHVPVPHTLVPGAYRVRFVVLGDLTDANGLITVWPPGIQVVVSDIDGTLTTSDWEAVDEVIEIITEDRAEMYPDANQVMRTWVHKGYRIVYLSGRPQYVNRYTHTWLARHGFPRGPILLTTKKRHLPPVNEGVQKFKAVVLNDLQTRVQVQWVAAYGNAITDIGAYNEASIPKDKTFIIGPHGGTHNTVRIEGYTSHLSAVQTYPKAEQPKS